MDSCTKCESSNIKVQFEAKGQFRSYNRSIDNVTNFMRNDTYYYQDEVRKEHLIYTCERCGYRIAKQCKDKEVKNA